MIRIEKEDLTLLCEERNMDGKKALVVKGFEGGSAVLDLSDCNIAEIERNIFVFNSLCNSFCTGCFTDTRFTYKTWIILCSS